MTTKLAICAVLCWGGFGVICWQTNWIVALGSLIVTVGIVAHNKTEEL